MAKLNVPYIPNDKIVSVKISGHFYKKLQTVFLAKGAERNKEEFLKILDRMKTNEPIQDLYEAEIEVLCALVVSIEKAAQEQGLVEMKEIDEEDAPPTT